MSSSRPESRAHQAPSPPAEPEPEPDVPIETLVEHLLSAKRSLSAMTSVLRANELCTLALQLYEEAVVLGSETEFLRRGMASQLGVLGRVRSGLDRTCEAGKREFKQLIRAMDGADAKMRGTVEGLRGRAVEGGFRVGEGDEGERSLMDFVDEKSVQGVVEALKGSVMELQVRNPPSRLFQTESNPRSPSRRPSTATSSASKLTSEPSKRPSPPPRQPPPPPPRPTSPYPPSSSP